MSLLRWTVMIVDREEECAELEMPRDSLSLATYFRKRDIL